jgi:isopenicillin N synthase-like dioxygenase
VIPLLDLSEYEDAARREAFLRRWDDTLATFGFAIVTGHGIPEPLSTTMYAAVRDFFDQPLNVKEKIRDPVPGGNRGYLPPGFEAVSQSKAGTGAPADLLEALSFSDLLWERTLAPDHPALKGHSPNLWPGRMPAFRVTAERYMEQATELGRRLMRISAAALRLPDDFFDTAYAFMTHKLRLVHYPDQVDEPLPGQLRAGAHTDFGGFTILRQDDAPGGLQVWIDDRWVDVPAVPGTLVINAGDLLQRWTNDRWRSNLHRVVNPPRDHAGSTRRISIVVFTGPARDHEVACISSCCSAEHPPRYAPIRAAEYTAQRLKETYAVTA